MNLLYTLFMVYKYAITMVLRNHLHTAIFAL